MRSPPLIAAAPITLRHITRGTQFTVLGASFDAKPSRGVNGRSGYQSGSYEPELNDEGKGTLRFANTAGDDGILHRRRFAIFTDAAYHPGDEWFEVLQEGRVLFVGTPTDATKSRRDITIELADALWMQNTQRETAGGFWTHAPRDVFEHYTKAWRPVVAEDFDSLSRWTTQNATLLSTGSARLTSTGSDAAGSAFITAKPTEFGETNLATQRAWRLEATYDRQLAAGGQVALAMASASTGSPFVRLTVGAAQSHVEIGSDVETMTQTRDAAKPGAALAIECRDRWVLFYIDGELVFTCELDTTTAQAVPQFAAYGAGTTAEVHSLLLRRSEPYLMRGTAKGDYHLPGILPAGGLRGTYYDEADLRSLASTPARYWRRALAPTRQPYARRQDAQVSFPTATPGWQPPGPPDNHYFSVRWTGAIYLDLAAADVTLELPGVWGAVRVWVGKTMYGQQLLDNWATSGATTLTSGSLRTHLGTRSGWYPLRIDFGTVGANQSAGIILRRSVGGAAYETVPSSALSPLGIYEAAVRYDSHAEQLKAIALAYGLQYRCEPRPLESGQFPGEVVPRVRVGRDTDKVLTPAESSDASVSVSAGDVVDTLLADAAGLGDQANSAQLTSEAISYRALNDGHLAVMSAYESLSDITDPVLLQTRLASMLGLRLTPWEEISARPRGHRELRDTLPMSGTIAAFAWEPGDGLRVEDDLLDLKDATPRQIIAPSWPFHPDGLGAPAVRFRQRPRSQRDALRALVRAVLLPQRNYQGQLVITNGNVAAQPANAFLTDTASRVSLPLDLSDVLRADLVVHHKTDSSAITINVNGASTGITFTSTGRYDLRAFVARDGTRPRMYAQLTGGTGVTEFALELLVRV